MKSLPNPLGPSHLPSSLTSYCSFRTSCICLQPHASLCDVSWLPCLSTNAHFSAGFGAISCQSSTRQRKLAACCNAAYTSSLLCWTVLALLAKCLKSVISCVSNLEGCASACSARFASAAFAVTMRSNPTSPTRLRQPRTVPPAANVFSWSQQG